VTVPAKTIPIQRAEPTRAFEFISTKKDELIGWARKFSLFPYPFVTACCAMELIAASFSKFDFDRLGTFPRPDPRHVDVMVVAGTITRKMAPAVKRLFPRVPGTRSRCPNARRKNFLSSRLPLPPVLAGTSFPAAILRFARLA
jgi:NADH:ubiquinone oxidoreductase subunit B-like Fe-S oxidoreductase